MGLGSLGTSGLGAISPLPKRTKALSEQKSSSTTPSPTTKRFEAMMPPPQPTTPRAPVAPPPPINVSDGFTPVAPATTPVKRNPINTSIFKSDQLQAADLRKRRTILGA